MATPNTSTISLWLAVREAGLLWSMRAHAKEWKTHFLVANRSSRAATTAKASGHVFQQQSIATTLSLDLTSALDKTRTTSVLSARMVDHCATLSLDGSAHGSTSLK